jgi:hypothetical protein
MSERRNGEVMIDVRNLVRVYGGGRGSGKQESA